MIKKISINYPTFGTGLDIKLDFNDGINLVEMPNGWGKTTVVNTISSFFTGKYPGLKKLPEGNAIIEGTGYNGMMNKGKWIGNPPTNDLYQYIIPGKFFQLTTPEMRNILTKVLKIDYDSFMLKHIPDWNPDLESDLKKKKIDYLSKEEVVLTDIMNLKSKIINNESKDFSDVEEFLNKRNLLFSEVDKFNKSIEDKINYYNSVSMSINGMKNYLKDLNDKLDSFDKKLLELQSNNTCHFCGGKIGTESLDKIKQDILNEKSLITKEINSVNKDIKIKENEFKSLIKPEYLDINDLENNSKKLLIDLPNVELSRFDEYEKYKFNQKYIESIKSDLEQKEKLLKEYNTIGIQQQLNDIQNAKVLFVEYLQKVISALPFDIELFQTYKNGSIKPSFIIKKDGVEYSSLSTGNKTLVEIQMAKLFIDALGLDFILIDESSHISKDNLITYIKELALYYQVILFKATGWTEQDLK